MGKSVTLTGFAASEVSVTVTSSGCETDVLRALAPIWSRLAVDGLWAAMPLLPPLEAAVFLAPLDSESKGLLAALPRLEAVGLLAALPVLARLEAAGLLAAPGALAEACLQLLADFSLAEGVPGCEVASVESVAVGAASITICTALMVSPSAVKHL